jgi:hypothetical protein
VADERNKGADIPHGTDEESSRIGSEPNTRSRVEDPSVRYPRDEDPAEGRRDEGNPQRTTSGGITSPKFGAAGSGGAELEPGPERD